MQVENYVEVNNKFNLIKNNIFNYCLVNKICSLPELIKIYKENRINVNKFELIGIINLLNYRFYEKKLPEEDILFKKIKFNNIMGESLLCLQKLGFNKIEIKYLEDYLKLYKKTISIISSLLLYRNVNKNSQNNDAFNNKLDIIIDYYYNMIDINKMKKVEYEFLLIKKKMILVQGKTINKNLSYKKLKK